jgi:hypothetical protein|tara:strand:+ start:134 stop:310 length:177 start_codon:yes stop_codon:yes gene_type:complete
MSYCRFENTARDLQDCVYALDDNDVEDLSSYEINGLRDLLGLAKEIVNMEEYIKEITK